MTKSSQKQFSPTKSFMQAVVTHPSSMSLTIRSDTTSSASISREPLSFAAPVCFIREAAPPALVNDSQESSFQYEAKSLSTTQPTLDGIWLQQTIRSPSVTSEEIEESSIISSAGKTAASLADALNQSYSHNSSLSSIPSHFPTSTKPQASSSASAADIAGLKASSNKAPAPGGNPAFRKLRTLPTRLSRHASNSEIAQAIDQGLNTQVLPTHYRPSASANAQSLIQSQELMLHRHAEHWLSALPDDQASKGKEAAQLWRGYSSPCYSEVGTYKKWLDTLFGPGDMLRGVGKQPKPQKVSDAETDPSSDAEININVDDAQGDSTDGEATKIELMRRRRQIE